MCKNKVQFQQGLSLSEFMDNFGTEAQCEAALEAAKWPNGFLCASCGHNSFSRLTRGRTKRQCNKCKYQTSLMAGTIFHGTKLPLTKWFLGMHLMTQSKNGISQMELARQLGIGINAAALMANPSASPWVRNDGATSAVNTAVGTAARAARSRWWISPNCEMIKCPPHLVR